MQWPSIRGIWANVTANKARGAAATGDEGRRFFTRRKRADTGTFADLPEVLGARELNVGGVSSQRRPFPSSAPAENGRALISLSAA